MAEKSLEDAVLEYESQKSANTVNAVMMAYAMGSYDKVKSLSAWMIAEGGDSKKYIPKKTESNYYENNWTSSFAIVSVFRNLADRGKVVFTGLRDGSYKSACRGFVDSIDVTVVVKKGSVVQITAANRKDDRPYSACEIVPKRILQKQSIQIDAVTSATITSAAVVGATCAAIHEAAGK
jgi:uncharacterized protein with FMN-binding domain